MTRIFTLFLLIVGSLSAANTQSRQINPNPQKVVQNLVKLPPIGQARFLENDTIGSPILVDTCSLQLVEFVDNIGWGLVGGTNGFGDFEKAQRMIYSRGNFEVTEIVAFFATATVVGDGMVRAKIYEVDPNSNGPGTLAGVSEPLLVSEINVDNEVAVGTFFTFSTPATVTGSEFFVSIDFSALYASQDTVGLLLTDSDCGFAEDAWELFDDGETWVSLHNMDISWDIISNFLFLANIQFDGSSATKELKQDNHRIRLYDAFPNPAAAEIIISYDLEMKTAVQLEIYATDGTLLKQINKLVQLPGQYKETISTEKLPPGLYLYGIKTDKGLLMNKFTKGVGN